MTVLSLAQLVVAETRTAIYERALSIAQSLGLPVSTWAPGDPTRSLYHLLAATLSNSESVVSDYIAAGFLDYSTGEWLVLLAKQVYGVDAIAATRAVCTATLTNTSGAIYAFDPGDITAKNSTSGATYKNTTGGTLSALGTLSIELEADEAGEAYGADIGEIDTLVTNYLGVSIANTTVAIGTDAEEDEALRDRCRAKLGALSPNGPRGAYEYAAITAKPGTVTRVKVLDATSTGTVTVYVAGPNGAITAPADITTITTALTENALPLGVTLDLQSAANKTITVTYQLYLYDDVGATESEIKATVATALQTMFGTRPIGGDNGGKIYKTLIERTILAAYPTHAFRVVLSAPTGDTTLAADEVAVLAHNPALSTVSLVPA